MALTSSMSQRRMSVATWSFLDLPVWSLPPTLPMSSSSDARCGVDVLVVGLDLEVPSFHSWPTFSRPATISSFSCSLSTPVLTRARA